jgi:short-subunit dehydrogenase
MARPRYDGKVVWITGASSGIGRSLALTFHQAGANLILSARSEDNLENVERECVRHGTVHRLPLDLADLESLPERAEQALGLGGRIDLMVHNAGVALRDLAVDTDLSVDREIMATNYLGPVALTKAVLPSMLAHRSGHFVVMSSLSGKYGGPRLSAYSASKHALHGFFESLRAEVHSEGIRITIVVPGFVRTPITVNALQGDGKTYGRMMRVHEKGMDPEECARRTLRGVAREKEEILIGGPEVYSVYLKRFFPNLLSSLIRKHPLKMLDRLFPSTRQP